MRKLDFLYKTGIIIHCRVEGTKKERNQYGKTRGNKKERKIFPC